MAAHRYWRAISLVPAGRDTELELICFHLMDAAGLRVDAPASLSASSTPSAGALVNLQDAELGTLARWPAGAVSTLVLIWDFGGTVDVADIRLAGDNPVKFLLCAKIQWSDDATAWNTLFEPRYIKWPGVQTLTSSVDYTAQWLDVGFTTATVFSGDKRTVSVGVVSTTVAGVLPKQSGIVQFEVQALGGGSWAIGLLRIDKWKQDGYFVNNTSACSYTSTGSKAVNGSQSAYGASFTSNDIIGVVVDFGTGSVNFYKNGVSQGAINLPSTLLDVGLVPACGDSGSNLASFKLTGRDLTYPVAGAEPWASPATIDVYTRPWNRQIGAVLPPPPIVGARLQPKVYGLVPIASVQHLKVVTGNTPDFKSGVMGTGRGRIAGTVKDKASPTNIPVFRKVRLFRERDGLLMRELWSDPTTGVYSFDFIDELQQFTVLSYDHTGVFQAVVANNLTPELIP